MFFHDLAACQGNDRCTNRIMDTPENTCRVCLLPCCQEHSIKINGELLCEICIAELFAAKSPTSSSGRQDRGRLDPAPGAYVSAPARYSEDELQDFADDFRPGDEI